MCMLSARFFVVAMYWVQTEEKEDKACPEAEKVD